MSELQPIDPLDVIREARAHLECGISQSVPSDDQIIIGHMRSASELLALVIEASTRERRHDMSDVREVLVKARELIAVKRRWAQKFYAFDKQGDHCDPLSADACRWCAIGALERCSPCAAINLAAEQALTDQIGNAIGEFNDTHTHAEVIAAFDRAIASTPSLSSPAKE